MSITLLLSLFNLVGGGFIDPDASNSSPGIIPIAVDQKFHWKNSNPATEVDFINGVYQKSSRQDVIGEHGVTIGGFDEARPANFSPMDNSYRFASNNLKWLDGDNYRGRWEASRKFNAPSDSYFSVPAGRRLEMMMRAPRERMMRRGRNGKGKGDMNEDYQDGKGKGGMHGGKMHGMGKKGGKKNGKKSGKKGKGKGMDRDPESPVMLVPFDAPVSPVFAPAETPAAPACPPNAPPTLETKTEMPSTEKPASLVPTAEPTKAPEMLTPASQEPTTVTPVTEAPTTQAPATEAPTSQTPESQIPTTPAPTTKEPTTSAPTPATPAPIRATPAPVRATPAPVRATPAPVRATPTPVRATPAPVRATPAPVRATPAPVRATRVPTPKGMKTRAPASSAPSSRAPVVAPVPVSEAPVTNAPETAEPDSLLPSGSSFPSVLTQSESPPPSAYPTPTGSFTRCFSSESPSIGCPDADIGEKCDKFNPLASFSSCLATCIDAYCCIHDSGSSRSSSCSQEKNCVFYEPCYIVWFKLADTIGPAPYLRLDSDDDFFDLSEAEIQQIFKNRTDFFNQFFGHFFLTDDLILEDSTFLNENNW